VADERRSTNDDDVVADRRTSHASTGVANAEWSPVSGKSFTIAAAGFHSELIGNPRALRGTIGRAQTELSPQL